MLAVGLNAPHAWTSCVRRRVAGLSPAARWLAVAQSATWLTYGLAEDVRLCALTGAAPVATLAALVGALSVVPQLWWLARAGGADSSGVSVTTTALSLVASLCWTAHGLALALPAVALPSLAGAVAAAWTLGLLRPPVRRPRPVPSLVLRQPLSA